MVFDGKENPNPASQEKVKPLLRIGFHLSPVTPNMTNAYAPPYKTGQKWLEEFLAMPEEKRDQTFYYRPDSGLVGLAIRETYDMDLGAKYDLVVHRTDGKRLDLRSFTEQALHIIAQNVARLQTEPSWIFELDLLRIEAATMRAAWEGLHQTASGDELRWYLMDESQSLEPQVRRAVLLRALNFPIGIDNKVPTEPNFGARIDADEGVTRVMQLHWGWGNPHIFYGLDFTKSDHKFTLIDKVVVASAFDIGKKFVLGHSFPQDCVYKVSRS